MGIQQSAQQGLDTWNRDLRAMCGHFDTELAFNRSLFIGEFSMLSSGGLPLASLRTNAGLIKRQVTNPDHDNDQDCFWSASAAAIHRSCRTASGCNWPLANCC